MFGLHVGKKKNQKSELEPRKKKRTKRKANSPLADTGQTGSENNKGQQAGCGKNRNNSQNVNIADSSNVNTRFSFLDIIVSKMHSNEAILFSL